MDMRYHFITYRVDVYWRAGRENLGDYHTKHHSSQHHKDMRGLILHQANSLQVFRGCVKLTPLPQPQLHTRIYTQTYRGTQRATQNRGVLARAYSVSIQNLNTVSTMTVP
jgi:hypothetical protein